MSLTPWKVTRSKYLIQDEWLTLRADSCETASGVIIDPFYILEKRDWAHVVALNQESEILIVWQYRHGARKITAEIPCGIIEDSDSSTLKGAKRELLEETGCTSERFQFVYSAYANPARQTNKIHCYLAQATEKTANTNLDKTEEIESGFVSLEELRRLIDKGDFSQVLHIASVYQALAKANLLHKFSG